MGFFFLRVGEGHALCLVLFGFFSLHLIVHMLCGSFDTKFPEEREHPLSNWGFLFPSEMLQFFLLLLDVTLDLESIFHSYSILLWFDISSA